MKTRIIRAPSKDTLNLIKSRSRTKFYDENPAAIGLVQGVMIDLFYYADLAEKMSNVQIVEINGNCPQTFISIGILGDISEVEEAIRVINEIDIEV